MNISNPQLKPDQSSHSHSPLPQVFEPEEIRLSNGIPVIFQHYEGPVATTYWWVKTGSADELPEQAGFAHFLEHMLFKDAAAKETGKASTGKMASAIESLGGDINAYTSFDQTVYHVTCAAAHWERVIDSFGTMAKPQKFLASDFKREREVILEELAKNEDSPGRQLFQALFTETFRKHPYGKPVIGYVKTLKAAKVGKLEAFYRSHYVSEKMGLVLVGPINDATGTRKKGIIRYLEKHFGKKAIPQKAAPKMIDRKPEPEMRGDLAFTSRHFDVKTPTLSVSFRVPDLLHEDVPALDLLAGILGMGELSRLYQRLFYQTSLVNDVSGGLYVPMDPGMLYFQTEMDSVEKIPTTAEELFKELVRIVEDGPTDEELSRVIVNVESERLYATQTADGMAGRLGFLQYILGDLGFDQKYINQLRAVDSAAIQAVAKKYFDYRRMSGVLMLPKEHKKYDLKPLEKLARAYFDPKPLVSTHSKGSATAGADLPVEFITLPSGMRAVFCERPQSHVFSVHIAALGGLRLELAQPVENAETDWGASYMMSLTWNKGTTHQDSRQIAALTEGHAASIDGFAGRNSVGLQLTGLARDWGKLSELLSDVLINPTFPDEEIEHSRRVAEDSVRSIEDHSSQLCSKLFLETLFETHPYGKFTTGSLESLKGMTRKKLAAFHEGWIRPEKLVVSLSGAVKRSEAEFWLTELDRKAKEAMKTRKSNFPPIKLADEPDLKGPRSIQKNLGREQVHILVGGLGSTLNAPDRHAIRLLQTLLGGQSGRLFIELREKKSLAYTVAPVSFEGMERGYIGTYIACSPGKKDEAIAGIQTVLEKLASKGPTAAEMSRAKEFFLGRRAMDLQGDSSLAAHYGLEALYHLPHLTEEEIVKTIRKVSAKEVQDVCRKYLIDQPMVTCTVG